MTTHSTNTNRRIATLTGFKPTGELHLGNYAGAIRPLARLAADEHRDVYVFVADLHALNGHPLPILPRWPIGRSDWPPHCWRAGSIAPTCTCTAKVGCRRSRGWRLC
jgi:hypothetical protein